MKLAVDSKDNKLLVVQSLSDRSAFPPHIEIDKQDPIRKRVGDE